jgi:hypothetical protein
MIIGLDDYFCYSSTQVSGERKALLEFFAKQQKWHLLPYMQFSWAGYSFIVEEQELVNYPR